MVVLLRRRLSAILAISKIVPTRSFSMSSPPSPIKFSFGVIADVQWADSPDGFNYAKTAKRCYRGALTTLGNAVDWWMDLPRSPLFVAQLGDIIDGQNHQTGETEPALRAALGHLDRLSCPSVNLVGNHELYNFNREDLANASWLKHGDREYHSFSPVEGWKVIVLDPYQISLIGHAADDPRRLEAVRIIERENPNVHPDGKSGNWFDGMDDAGERRRFVPYNGGFGEEQLAWFQLQLTAASEANERVLVCSHVIIHPKACGGFTMAWDYKEALDVIRSEGAGGCVSAVLCGHDHRGKYYCDDFGVHHCTFISPLNKGDEGFAFGLVHVRPDCMEIRGPKIDDLLPDSVGRPTPTICEGDSYSGPCESITLPFTERALATNKKVAVEKVARL